MQTYTLAGVHQKGSFLLHRKNGPKLRRFTQNRVPQSPFHNQRIKNGQNGMGFETKPEGR